MGDRVADNNKGNSFTLKLTATSGVPGPGKLPGGGRGVIIMRKIIKLEHAFAKVAQVPREGVSWGVALSADGEKPTKRSKETKGSVKESDRC